ncbi:hypothetical protein NOI87_31445, partial [Neorhizobium galegae]|nr:hypothetical protein [Neorhizobium galegae]
GAERSAETGGRRSHRHRRVARRATRMAPFPDLLLRFGDVVLLKGPSSAIDRIVSSGKLQLSGKPLKENGLPEADIISLEAIVSQESALADLSASAEF